MPVLLVTGAQKHCNDWGLDALPVSELISALVVSTVAILF